MSTSAGRRVIPVAVDTAAANPLGPVSNIINRGADTALLRPSIKTSVTGVRQVIHALEAGTREVKSYLLNEVNIIYECKVCMNMFRSLANLTAHKRSFCMENFKEVNHIFSSKTGGEAAQLQTVVIEAEPVETVIPEPHWDVENYSPSLELLKDAGVIAAVQEMPVVNRLLPPNKRSLCSVVKQLAGKVDEDFYKKAGAKLDTQKQLTKTEGICLEPLKQSNNAQFQSWTTGFEYKEVQQLKNGDSTVAVAPTGQELPKGDMNGALDRAKSPTSSEGSKENMNTDFEAKSDTPKTDSNTVRYPCPECKKGFSKVNAVYKHLGTAHGKTSEEYIKMRKDITNNAYVVEDPKLPSPIEDTEEKVPEYEFKKTKKKEKSLQLALAVGLVNRNGVGMQKINKPLIEKSIEKSIEKPITEKTAVEVIEVEKSKSRGRPKKSPLESMLEDNGQDFPDSDTEISFSKDKYEDGVPNKKRKRVSLGKEGSTEGSWNSGLFQCHMCEKSFKTQTFLLQHYVSHFKLELKRDFRDSLSQKKCPTCDGTFDSEAKLSMHLGATHREVIRYLPPGSSLVNNVKNSPVKSKVPVKAKVPVLESTPVIPCRNFLELVDEEAPPVSSEDILSPGKKDASPKAGSPKSSSGSPPKSPGRGRPRTPKIVPEIQDEFMV